MSLLRRSRGRLATAVSEAGNAWQRRLIALLTLTQILDAADRGSLGAMAPSIKEAFDISNTQFGVLAAVVVLVGGLSTLPAGVLVDRWRRTALLSASLVLWALAMGFSAVATSFGVLLVARVALGVVLATAGPATASIVGDVFEETRRGTVMGWIRLGELIGLGVGFVAVGVITWVTSWRIVFATLGAVAIVVAIFAHRTDEPPRTSGELRLGASEAANGILRGADVEPSPDAVLRGDQQRMPLGQVLRYALRIRTNVLVVIAESAGDFFLGGVATFAVVFVTQQFGISQATAAFLLPVMAIGAVTGALGGGRLGDWLVSTRGIISGRLWVAAAGYAITAAAFVPVAFTDSIPLALLLLTVAGLGLAAAGPTLDAVRIDVVVSPLRGRVEAIRTVLRTLAIAGAPLTVGVMSDNLAGGGHAGLRLALLLLTPLLAVNSLLVAVATRSYPSDVAAVAASSTEERQLR